MIIAVDFDGVLFGEGTEFPDIGCPNFTMVSLIRDIVESGHEVVLWTSRTDKELESALRWCNEFDLHFVAVNDNAPSNKAKYGHLYPNGTRKVSADIYIDDHNPEFILDRHKYGQLIAIHKMAKRIKEILSWEEEN